MFDLGDGRVHFPFGRASVHGVGAAAHPALVLDQEPQVPGARVRSGEPADGDGAVRHHLLQFAGPAVHLRAPGVRRLDQSAALFRHRHLRI